MSATKKSPCNYITRTFHFKKAVVANSFDAHRLSHLAKKYGKQNKLAEKLFADYFTEGKNTADYNTLLQIGTDLGLDVKEIGDVLKSDTYANEVHLNIKQAQQIGVSAVPFFVLDNKYAISGDQESDTFLQALKKAYEEAINDIETINNGDVCGPDGCEI